MSHGVHFGVYSRYASKVHVALFKEGVEDPVEVLQLPSCHGHIFQGFVPNLEPGTQYGFYADGPFDPRNGQRFNPRKFLLDPYARSLHGTFRNVEGVLNGYAPGGDDADLFLDHRPSHAFMPKCLIPGGRFDWEGVHSPGIPREQLVIYEAHVRSFTAHPSSGVSTPGTYLGLVEKIPYLKSLGVNALELLPVMAKCSEDFLVDKGLSNYWGYNTASFFALEPSYGSKSRPGCEIEEFKIMVRELHRAGIEIILDVVYNHTPEGSERGPTLSFRGLDNRSYYALTGSDDGPLRRYHNHTGCGNTLDFGSLPVLRLVLDSLRYFVEEFHIDGFRFDLATVHGREGGGGFDPAAPFFAAVAQDPVLRKVKMIAEPWDLGAYALGRFPDGWMEWNGGFRDIIRRWVRGESGLLQAVKEKLEGSAEVYEGSGREPWAGMNFVTCHDGFTLRDLVSYNQKHNEANLENNMDGSNDNHAWNSGEEGGNENHEVESLRHRQARNLMLLNLFSRGIPMVSGGDELLRTQGGNNNAYCQDNEISWHDWTHDETRAGFLRFFTEAVSWRKMLKLPNNWASVSDRAWKRCWQARDAVGRLWPVHKAPPGRHAAFLLKEEKQVRFYFMLNGEDEEKTFNFPPLPPPWYWARVIDTSLPSPEDILSPGGVFQPLGDRYKVVARSSVLLYAVQEKV